jgi:hypothetical protein
VIIAKKFFVILHTPPSKIMPHVTTKQIVDASDNRQKQTLIAKNVVYVRYGANSDLATPSQFHRIIEKRTDILKTELLRRVKEIEIPIPGRIQGSAKAMRAAKISDDPNAVPVRLTKNAEEASGILLREELANELFDEINNVLEANNLLAKEKDKFYFAEPVYYRIYAERQHVLDNGNFELLARTAFLNFYAPGLFWFLNIPSDKCAKIIFDIYRDAKQPYVHHLVRIAGLLPPLSDWLTIRWENRWQRHPQPPRYTWTLKSIRNEKKKKDIRLAVTSTIANTPLTVDDITTTYARLLESPQEAAALLSKSCMSVFEGSQEQKSMARKLDIMAYGKLLSTRSAEIVEALNKIEESEQDAGATIDRTCGEDMPEL